MRSFRRTLEGLRPYRLRVVLAILMTLGVTILQILPPRLYQWAIDRAITPALRLPLGQRGPYLDVLTGIAATLVGVIALRNVFSYVNSTTLTWLGHRFVFDLRFRTWRHLHRLSLAFHQQTQVGKIMARVTADIELIQGLIQGQLVQFITDVVTLVAVVGMLFAIQWKLATVIAFLIPFYVIGYLYFLRQIREVSQAQRKYYDEMLGKLAEKVAGMAVVKAFVREDAERASFMETVRNKFGVDMRQVHLNRRLGLVSGVVSAVGTGVVYAYGGRLVQAGELTGGGLVAISFYIGFVFNPAVRVVDFNNSLQWAVSAMDRVFATLDTRAEVQDSPNAMRLREPEGRVTFENVSFGYGNETRAVEGIDLEIAPGETVAFVGHSGAGKSTLMHLLMRFYDPANGSVKVDGHDVRSVRMDSLRRTVSMVAQENVLFSVSLSENIRYGNREATPAQVEAASRAADLHEFVAALPEGYETMVGDGGIKLSGGQKQRLALARALVTDPRILILDDVTSALDGETEARVQEALDKTMTGRATLVIAHRLSSVVMADRIVVMDHGKIADIGSHAELVARPGPYRTMYDEQFRSVLSV